MRYKGIKSLLILFILQITLITGTLQAFGFGTVVESFEDEKRVPILMYHFLSKSEANPNRWKISPNEFEEDLKYLKEQGYETIFVKDLIDYVHNMKQLPEKPVMITFDDGDSSVHRYAFPLLKKYDMKAVVSIIGWCTDEYSMATDESVEYYPNLTWEQIKDLRDSGLVEIQNHSYNLHTGSGIVKKSGESNEEYHSRFSLDLQKLQSRMKEELDVESTAFVFPFGNKSDESNDILKDNGFYASMTCYEKINTIKMGHPETLFDMGRILRPHGMESHTALEKLN